MPEKMPAMGGADPEEIQFDSGEHEKYPADQEGFITKEAAETWKNLESIANLAKVMHQIEDRPKDILHEKALKENKAIDKERERRESNLKKSVLEDLKKRDVYGNGRVRAETLAIIADNQRFREDMEVMCELAKANPEKAIELADPATVKIHREFFFSAIGKERGRAELIETANPALLDDPSFIKEIIDRTGGTAILYAGPKVLGDRKMILEAIGHYVSRDKLFSKIDPKFRSDKELIKATGALKEADPSLKDDKEFALEMVAKNGHHINDVGPALRKDRDLLLKAAETSYSALELAPKELKLEVANVLIKSDKSIWADGFFLAAGEYRDDKDFMLQAAQRFGAFDTLRLAEKELSHDRGFLLALIKLDPRILHTLANGDNYRWHFRATLMKDPTFLAEAVKTRPEVVQYLPYEVRKAIESLKDSKDGFVKRITKEILEVIAR